MTSVASLIFGLHAILMVIDEFYFHQKRGLGTWERRGHPLDTLTVILPTVYLTFNPDPSAYLFLILAVLSCLFVTKDEWIHTEECPATEQWLHSILFLLHPVLFWLMWSLQQLDHISWLHLLLCGQTGFLIYQVVRWKAWK